MRELYAFLERLWSAFMGVIKLPVLIAIAAILGALLLPTLAEAKRHIGWTQETRRVKVATPQGEKSKEITYYKNTLGMEFVKIPAGEFMMGSPAGEEGRGSNEGPQHRVRITKPFYMGAHEVTQEQYEKVMGKNPAQFKGPKNPVEQVSWHDAVEFCKRLSQGGGIGYRLPTEAEWEYACRAGTTTRFYFGDSDSNLGDYAWHPSNSSRTHPVGQKKPNAFGLCDMHGNVWEWCQSLYKDYPYRADDGREDLRAAGSRVLRGGSWCFNPRLMRSASRFRLDPSLRYRVGFRIRAVSHESF